MNLPSPKISTTTIRPLSVSDWAPLLRLNAENRPAVAPLQEAELAHLMGFDGCHLVATDVQGEVVAYLLSFPNDSAYDDTEFRWFRRHLVGPFFYICQIVVEQKHRQQQIGYALYHHLLATARQRGSPTLCCDVNTDPPNINSFAFHHSLGFAEVGSGHASDGTAIAFLARIF